MRLRHPSITTWAAALPLSRPFPGSPLSWNHETIQSRHQGRKRTVQLYSTAYNNNSFHVPDVRVVFCLRIVILSYAGNNLVMRGPKHHSLPAYDGVIVGVRHTTHKWAWPWNQARLFASLIGSNHDNGHVVCRNSHSSLAGTATGPPWPPSLAAAYTNPVHPVHEAEKQKRCTGGEY